MKKFFAVIAAMCSALILLSACDSGNVRGEDYDALNKMLDENYTSVELTVTETFDEDTILEGKYTITYDEAGATVSYTVEQLASFNLNGDLPASYKETLSGKVLVSDGSIKLLEGDDIGLSVDILGEGFHFDKDYFENADSMSLFIEGSGASEGVWGTLFTADVKDSNNFLGYSLSCTAMKLDVRYTTVLSAIRISYTSEVGSAVSYLYQFTK